MLYNEKKKEMKKMKMILGLVVAAGVVAGGISYKNAHSSRRKRWRKRKS